MAEELCYVQSVGTIERGPCVVVFIVRNMFFVFGILLPLLTSVCIMVPI